MVVGTRLVRKSQATADLNITAGSPQIKCLFCHRKGAVTMTTTAVMKPVWDHFDANSASKHRANELSIFDGGSLDVSFDCQDCHTSLGGSLVADAAGNASIHGVDASTTTKNVYLTLIGSLPAAPTSQQLSTSTCGNVVCHGGQG